MVEFRKLVPLIPLLTAAMIIPSLSVHPSQAQFIPCKIVNLNIVPPSPVQAGQPFQITTNLTVSCDPSVLPIVRVDLLDATSSATLSTNSIPYYPPSSSFVASVVNEATARQFPGSWALEVQAYVLSGLNGQSVASTAQLFQVNVEPYAPPVTAVQTTETTTQVSNASFVASTQLFSATISFENVTEATTSSQILINTQMTSNPIEQLLVLAAILLAGLVIFGLLMFGARRRMQQPAAIKRCSQCGTELTRNQKYCTSCGAKQAKWEPR